LAIVVGPVVCACVVAGCIQLAVVVGAVVVTEVIWIPATIVPGFVHVPVVAGLFNSLELLALLLFVLQRLFDWLLLLALLFVPARCI
jgi:hypothetical protein